MTYAEIEHRTTRERRQQSSGFIERFHRTLLDEYLRVAGRKFRKVDPPLTS